MDDLIKQIIILHTLKYKDKPSEEQTQNVLNQTLNKSKGPFEQAEKGKYRLSIYFVRYKQTGKV